MKYLLPIYLIFSAFDLFSQATLLWEKEVGGGEDDWGYSICLSDEGNYVFTGITSSYDEEVTDSLGGTDVWLAQMSQDSTMVWSHTFGGTKDERANSVCLAPDGGFALTGFTASGDVNFSENKGAKDIFIFKTNSQGELQWSKTYGGSSDDIGNSIIPSTDGGFLIAGSTFSSDGDVSSNHGSSDYWIIRIDGNGNLLWEKTYAGSAEDRAQEIVQTQDGNYVIIGTSFSGDGDVSDPLGSVDFWLIKINANGDLLWEKSLGGSSADQGYDLIETSDGSLLLVGEVLSNNGDVEGNHGLTDAWMVKLSSDGNIIWQNALGGSKVDYFLAVQEAADGTFIATGNTFSSDGDVSQNIGSSDIWLVKVDVDGNLIWEMSIGYDLNEIGNDLALQGEEIIIVGGIQVDHFKHGNSDVYIAKLESPLTSVTQIQAGTEIKVYPNPSHESITIQSEQKIESYSLFDVQGKLLRSLKTKDSLFAIPIFDLPNGNYFLLLEMESGEEFSTTIMIAK